MKNLHFLFTKMLIIAVTLAFSIQANAQLRTAIISVADGAWNNPATWSPAQIPALGDDVTISHEVTVSTNQAANSVMVSSTGTLKVMNATLNVGDDVNDALKVDGGTLYFGNGATINVAGYYKQTYIDSAHKGKMTSASGAGNAYFNIATAGERNDNSERNYSIQSGCVMAIDIASKQFILKTTIKNGNAGSALEVYFGTLSTQEASYIARTLFVVENASNLSDLYMLMNSTSVGKFFCNIGLGNVLHWSQTIEARKAQIAVVQMQIDSGILQLEPGTGLTVGQKVKVESNGELVLNSDASGEAAVLIYTSDDPPAKVRRYITGNGWHFISPSTTNVVSGDLDQGGDPNVWLTKFDESDIADHWKYIVTTTEPMPLAKGYSVYSEDLPRSDDFVIEYDGMLNSQMVTVNLDYSGAGDNDPDYGYNLVGNPFSASLNFKKAGPSIANDMHETIWVWDPNHNNGDGTYGRYVFYSWQGGGNYNGVVPIGQAFLVQATSSANPYIEMLPEYRVMGFSNWLKSSENSDWDDNNGLGTYVMFKVTNGVSNDEAFISFGENGTTGYENGYDALKFIGNPAAPQLYLRQDGKNLSMNYLKSLTQENERVVAMSFDAAMSGEYTLMANLDSLADTKVTLEDLTTGMNHDFASGSYVFTTDKNDNPDRFLVHFMYTPTSIGDDQTENAHLNIYSYNKAVYIGNNSIEMESGSSQVFIYDILGREIYSNKMKLDNLTRIPVNINNSYVIVKVIGVDYAKTQKVFVK